jgi:hypothetical protein
VSLAFANNVASNRIQRTSGLVATTSAFTHTFWVKRTGTWPTLAIISNMGPSPETTGHFIVVNDQNHANDYEVNVQINWAATQAFTNFILPLNTWVFFALIGNGTTISIKYWDGSAYQTASNTQTAFTPAQLRWGATAGGFVDSFTGLLAHIREWDAVLTDAQLTAERTSSTHVRTANLVAVHALDGGSVAAAVVGAFGGDYVASAGTTYSADMPSIAAAATVGTSATTLDGIGLDFTGTLGAAPDVTGAATLDALTLAATGQLGTAPSQAITLYLSGGASSPSALGSIGGAKSSFVVPNRPFGVIANAFFAAGNTQYRCWYVQTDGEAASLRAWIVTDTQSPFTAIALGWGAAAKNVTESAIANVGVAPAGVTFELPTSYETAPSGGAFSIGDWRALWVRYAMSPTTPIPSENFTIRIAAEP